MQTSGFTPEGPCVTALAAGRQGDALPIWGRPEALGHALHCPAECLLPRCQASPSIPLLEPRPDRLPP